MSKAPSQAVLAPPASAPDPSQQPSSVPVPELPASIPAGVLPLFLTTATQDLFKVRAGEDVTVEKPMKIIPKADLLADLHARLAIGDFYPAKQQIMEFPEDEMLLYYDPEFKYGQNFFICVTVPAMEAFLKPIVPQEAIDPAVEAAKTARSRKWESLGSDLEIEGERVVSTRDLIHVKVSRKRREFGSTCKFGDRDAHDAYLESKPFRDPTYDLSRMEVPNACQAIPEVAHSQAQTAWYRPLNFAVQYHPIVMPPEEQESIMSSDSLMEFVQTVTIRFEKALQQNGIMDIFRDDYRELGDEDVALEQGVHAYLQEYQSFTDLKHSKDKSISCVDWHPVQRGVVAISCARRVTFDDRVELGDNGQHQHSSILIWSFHDPIHPQLILHAPDDIMCLQFDPRDPNIIAGGCINGQIVLWDIAEYQDKLKSSRKTSTGGQNTGDEATGGDTTERVTETPALKWLAVSSIEFGHRAAVTDIQWLPSHIELGHSGEAVEHSEGGHRQLVTTSLDGQVAFWDTKYKKELKALDLVWKPFQRVPLSAMDNTFDYGLTKISILGSQKEHSISGNIFPPTSSQKKQRDSVASGFSSKFFCATEEGDLIYSDWTDKASEEKASRVEHAYSYHFGPMSDLQRSPFFPDILLSVGGWSFHIWKEKVTAGPLLSSTPSPSYLICGRWSPTRPGVFYISKADGTIEIWDLLDRSHVPTTTQNISSIAISYMAIRQYSGKSQLQHQFIAAGDDEGTLHILEVPRNLTKASKNEKSFVRAFFDREVRRLNYVQERKQLRAKERARFDAIAM
ncbi:WD40-repeat-containing domain protein, partial [Blyttiomyces helicus]